jgi:hypothetical protein
LYIQSQSLSKDTIFFKSGYNKACYIVGDSEDHIYAKFISMDINPGDTVTMSFQKEDIIETNNSKYSKGYFDLYVKQDVISYTNGKEMNSTVDSEIQSLNALESFSVASHDQREMVVDGSQNEYLIGYSYTSVGIAYPCNTKPKVNVSVVLSDIICDLLNENGTNSKSVDTKVNMSKDEILNNLITDQSQGNLLITIKKLRVDIQTISNAIFTFRILMEIYDNQKNLLLSKEFSGAETFMPGWSYKKQARKKVPIIMKSHLQRQMEEIGILKIN